MNMHDNNAKFLSCIKPSRKEHWNFIECPVALIPRHRSRFLVPSFSFTHYPTPFQRRDGRISRQRCFRSSSSFSFSRSRLFGSRFTLPSQEGAPLLLGLWCFGIALPRFLVEEQWLMDTCHLPSGAPWRQRKKKIKNKGWHLSYRSLST